MSREVIDILEDLPPYQGDQRMITRRQDTFDIIREILRKHKGTMAHYDAICEQHWKGNPQATAQGLYNFLKSHAPYRVEPTLKQTVKTPAAILSERLTFGNDCKHYASYIVGVGEALRRRGYPVKSFYRFASYTRGSKNPGHVFGVFVIDGKEFWIDPVPEIPGFNARTPVPSYTTDRMPPMSKNGSRIGSLYDISGISNEDRISGRHAHWLDQMDHAHKAWLHPVNKNMPAEMRMQQRRDPLGRELQPVQRYAPQQGHTHQHLHWLDQPKPHYYDLDVNSNLIGKAKKKHPIKIHAPHLKIHAPKIKVKIPHIKIQPGKILLTATLAPARGSFLLLTEINMFDLGVKMWEKAAKDQNGANWKKLAAEWKKLGGKPNALLKSIKKGVNTHNKLHSKKKISGEIYDFYSGGMAEPSYGIGVVAAAPAAIAAAAPIIAALTNLLKSFGINTNKAKADSADALSTVAKKHNKHGKNTDDNGDTTHDDGTVTSADQTSDGNQVLNIKDVPGAKDADNGSGPDAPTPGPTAGGSDAGGDDSSAPATIDDGDSTISDDNVPATKKGGGAFADTLESVKLFISDHKVYFIGGAIAIAALIIFKIVHKPAKGRGRR